MRRSDPIGLMRRGGHIASVLTGAVLAVALLIGSGCVPSTTDVRVDLDSLAREPSSRVELASMAKTPQPPPPAAEIIVKMPGRSSQTVRDPSRTTKDSLLARVESEQQQALARLESGLAAVSESRVRAYRVRLERDQESYREKASADTLAQLDTIFHAYAEQRKPKVLRLGLLVGYPDPNPTSAPPREQVKPYVQKRFDEAKAIRSELAELDRTFQDQTEILLKKQEDLTVAQRAQMEVRITNFREELKQKAAEASAAEVSTDVKALGLRLIDPTPLPLSAVVSRTIEIPGEAPLPRPPQVPSEQISRGPSEIRRQLEHELGIWLALNRYRQSAEGRDATEEFRKWRETYRGGL